MTNTFSSYTKDLNQEEEIRFFIACLAKLSAIYNISNKIIEEVAKDSLKTIHHNRDN